MVRALDGAGDGVMGEERRTLALIPASTGRARGAPMAPVQSLGERLARAVAAKDHAAVRAVLAPDDVVDTFEPVEDIERVGHRLALRTPSGFRPTRPTRRADSDEGPTTG